MSRESNTGNLMDIEPGGEQTQYEGTSIFMKPHEKSRGSFGGTSNTTDDLKEVRDKNRNHASSDENNDIERMAEQGYAGQTVGNQGEAAKGAGYGKIEDGGEGNSEAAAKTRREQGYGPGSSVGA